MKKTAGTPTTRKDLVSILNLGNPTAYAAYPDFYMPSALSDRNGLLSTGDIDLDKTLWLTLTNGLAGAGVGALTRYLTKAPDQEVIDDLFKDPSRKLRTNVKNQALSKVSSLTGSTMGMLGPTLGWGLGAYGGYTIMDKLMDRQRKRQLKSQLVDLYKKLDEMNYKKLIEARPELKPEEPENKDEISKEAFDWPSFHVTDYLPQTKNTGLLNSANSLAILTMALAMGAGGIAGYGMAHEANPARARLKQLKAVLAHMNQEDNRTMPVNVQTTPFVNHVLKKFNKLKADKKNPAAKAEVRELDMPKVEGVSLEDKLKAADVKARNEATQVDSTDPTMSII